MLHMLPLFAAFLIATPDAPSSYESDTRAWRAARERDLRSETGWLTVAGLTFLRPGVNVIGSAADSDVVLPRGAAPIAGRLTRDGSRVSLDPEPGAGLTLNDAAVTGPIVLSRRDRVQAGGGVTFQLHESGDRIGVRVRDVNSALRRRFAGLRWFPVRASWRIEARFVPYDTPRQITVANVLGDFERLTIPGEVVFSIGGREARLQAAQSGTRLWFIFSDALGGRETYRIRFLYADAPSADGRVTLDFNRAYNPPCAYNPFTTCPVPPPPNRLRVAIGAGEQIYRAVTLSRQSPSR